MGVVVCVIFSITVMATANVTVTRQVTYGVNVVYNGQAMQFLEESRPFIMDGRTFLPLRAISDVMGYPIEFESSSNTVFIGNRHLGTRTPLNVAVPFFETGYGGVIGTASAEQAFMGGNTYRDALVYTRGVGGQRGVLGTVYSLHNLNGQFRALTGHIGRVDGSRTVSGTFRFYGDGRLLETYELRAQDPPTEISIFLEDIRLLRIEFISDTSGVYALAAFVE